MAEKLKEWCEFCPTFPNHKEPTGYIGEYVDLIRTYSPELALPFTCEIYKNCVFANPNNNENRKVDK